MSFPKRFVAFISLFCLDISEFRWEIALFKRLLFSTSFYFEATKVEHSCFILSTVSKASECSSGLILWNFDIKLFNHFSNFFSEFDAYVYDDASSCALSKQHHAKVASDGTSFLSLLAIVKYTRAELAFSLLCWVYASFSLFIYSLKTSDFNCTFLSLWYFISMARSSSKLSMQYSSDDLVFDSTSCDSPMVSLIKERSDCDAFSSCLLTVKCRLKLAAFSSKTLSLSLQEINSCVTRSRVLWVYLISSYYFRTTSSAALEVTFICSTLQIKTRSDFKHSISSSVNARMFCSLSMIFWSVIFLAFLSFNWR